MYTIKYSEKAAKKLKNLDHHTSAIIYSWIEKNLIGCKNPRLYGKPLVGDKKGYWRYRVGAYRLIADIQDNLVRIEIINVAHRREVYEK
jgi:mRNA interferase RelE/StbE